MGKREQWEFPASCVPGELMVLDWYQQSLWLGWYRISSGSCRCCSSSSALMHLHQPFHSSQTTLIFLFSGWNISGRMDVSSWTGDRKIPPRCQVAKHPPCPAAQLNRSVETEDCCSKGPTGSVKYKDRRYSRTNELLFPCLYCGRLEAALCKVIKAFSRSSN